MATATFAVTGSDVVEGGTIGTNSTGGSNGLGEVTFSGGAAIFEADDIVVIEVVDVSADGEIVNGSAISDITVFDTYQDYLDYVNGGSTASGLIKYNYEPQNPGQTATVQSDISGLGDSYVRFNANVLLPSDGGPTLSNTLTIAPGTNLAYGGEGSVTIDRVRDFDLDYDTVIDAGTNEEGNANFYVGDYVEILNGGPVCWTAGSQILTDRGPRNVETLSFGDMVQTLDKGDQPVRWIGRRRMPALGKYAPVRFEAGAIGNPTIFEVSQNHRILLCGPMAELLYGEHEVLVAAKHMINDSTIHLRTAGWVEYVHVLFDEHQIVMVDDVASESLMPCAENIKDDWAEPRSELLDIFPDLADLIEQPHQSARICLNSSEARVLLANPMGRGVAPLTTGHLPRPHPRPAGS
ncbi:Hint domain-containing protein [Arenibacterium sp. CAU 1754]